MCDECYIILSMQEDCLDSDVCWKFDCETKSILSIDENGDGISNERDVYGDRLDCSFIRRCGD